MSRLAIGIGQGLPCSRDLVLSEQPPKLELDVRPPPESEPSNELIDSNTLHALQVVYTWVNGSDPRWEVQRALYLNQTEVSPEPPSARHYRSFSLPRLRQARRAMISYWTMADW